MIYKLGWTIYTILVKSKPLKCRLGKYFRPNMFIDVSADVPVPGGRLNKKDGLTRYGDSHVKDKTS